MKQFSKTFIYRLPVIALCGFIFWQSSFPSAFSEPLFPHDDKVMHILAYALLSFLSARCLAQENLDTGKVQRYALLFTIVFGLSDEIHQAFIPQRFASGYDLMADALGAAAGLIFYRIAIKNRALHLLV